MTSTKSVKPIFFLSIAIYLVAPSTVLAQTPLSLDHFTDMDSWPIYAPGDIKVDKSDLGNIRVGYDAQFALPDSSVNLGNTIDIMGVMFNGKPADWMQWNFTSEVEGVGGVANLDLLVMDKDTGALMFRMLPASPNSKWGGPYNFIGVNGGDVKRVKIEGDSKITTESFPVEHPIFDFGGMPFVFPFMDLKTGQGFRLRAYQHSGADGVHLLGVKVIGATTITDTHGKVHQVQEVQTLAPNRNTRVSFYISDKVPYFYGYDYRKVEDGTSLFKMIYRGYIITDIPR